MRYSSPHPPLHLTRHLRSLTFETTDHRVRICLLIADPDAGSPMHVDSSQFYETCAGVRPLYRRRRPGALSAVTRRLELGLADVVQSTKAIRENRYKAVNMAGASVIAAVANALGNRDFPFVFGGDGASFAVPPADADLARADARRRPPPGCATSSISPCGSRWCRSRTCASHGFAVDIARFAPSPDVSYAMFSGGGMAWAEAAMKRGAYAIPAGPPGARLICQACLAGSRKFPPNAGPSYRCWSCQRCARTRRFGTHRAAGGPDREFARGIASGSGWGTRAALAARGS